MAYLFCDRPLGNSPSLPGLDRGPVCSLGCLKPSVPTVSRFANRATFASRVRLRTQFVVGVGTGRTLTGAGRRLKAHAPRLKIVSIGPEILPGIEGLTRAALRERSPQRSRGARWQGCGR